MSKPRECPFCGDAMWLDNIDGYFGHPKSDCILSGHWYAERTLDVWNTRAEDPSKVELVEALEGYRQAMNFTRQYVGYAVLPEIPGWSWYDADVKAIAALARAKGA